MAEYILQKKIDMSDNSSSGSGIEKVFFGIVKKLCQFVDYIGRMDSLIGCCIYESEASNGRSDANQQSYK